MNTQPLILVAEDEDLMRVILSGLLEGAGYRVALAASAEEALEKFTTEDVAVTLTDIRMAGMDGLALLDRIKDVDPEALVVVMTAYSSVETAVAALRKGAYDYVTKPFVNEDLLQSVKNALRQRELFRENRALRRGFDRRYSFSEIIGTSPALQSVFRLVEKVAGTNTNILIEGESGTGKELIARAIHHNSPRSERPFVAINCGALPENLLESELFGHVKGAFTGAVRDKQGLFAAARGGSFFLDEVGEMPASLQVKLLRVLQEREAIPVGATEPIPVDVRIIAATNRELEEEIRRGNFRSDLFYRLNVIAINLPALRERRDDLLLLIEALLQNLATETGTEPKALAAEALDAVMVYEWPGNVRELENALEHAVVLTRGNLIEAASLPERITKRRKEPLVAERSYRNPTLEVIERAYIMWVLQAEGGNKTRAAEVLGIDPSTLYRKLSRYEEQVEVRV